MLFYANEYFENTDMRQINLWSTQFGAERADRDQIFGYRIQDACDKFGVKNSLGLFCYAATVSTWYSKAPRDRAGQVKWCEDLAEQFSKLGDIRLLPMTDDQQVIMSLVWTQATARLNEYAKFKKPVEPKLPDPKQPEPKPKPIEVGGKKEEEKKPEVPTKPIDTDKEGPSTIEQQDQKSMTKKAIGAIANALTFFVNWLPVPLPVKAVIKAILFALAAIFK
jgi:hypothetical protein